MRFSPYLGIGCGGGGVRTGLVHNVLMHFTLGSSKIEVFKTYFFDTVIT